MLKGSQLPNLNASIHPESSTALPADMNSKQSTDLVTAASGLLPLLVSHLPQRYLDIPLRSLLERTAILTHNKDAMLACIMNPFVGKDGRAITGIIPYATREFGNDAIIELLVRPRMPVVPSVTDEISSAEATIPEEPEDEDMATPHDSTEEQYHPHGDARIQHPPEQNGVRNSLERQGFGNSRSSISASRHSGFSVSTSNPTTLDAPDFRSHALQISRHTDTPTGTGSQTHIPSSERMDHGDVRMSDESLDSDDESVHLTMELDTDPEESS
jgi:pre-rRNA-processing protein RIX1